MIQFSSPENHCSVNRIYVTSWARIRPGGFVTVHQRCAVTHPYRKPYAPFPLPVGGGAVNQLTVTRRSTFGAGFRHSDTTRSSHNFARRGVVPVKIKFNILEHTRLWLFQTMTMEELSKKKRRPSITIVSGNVP